MVGGECGCEARVLKRIVGRKLVDDKTVRVMKVGKPLVEDLALAKALDRAHELEWKLSEAQKEIQNGNERLVESLLTVRRLEEKLAFTQRALDVHVRHCETTQPYPLPLPKDKP
jgi:uncharacterized coiled-coil protein SlyX